MENSEYKREKIIHFRPIFQCFIALFLGIVSAKGLFAGETVYIVLLACSLVLLCIGCGIYKKWIPIVCLILAFIFGIGLYSVGIKSFSGKEFEDKQTVTARVTDDIYENSSHYSLVLEDCFIGEENIKGISLHIYKDNSTKIEAGDIIKFSSYIDNVRLFNLHDFNSFYVRDNTSYSASVNLSNIKIVRGDLRFDEKVRKKIKDLLYENMDESNAGVAFAVLTGDKTDLDQTIKDVYKGAGIIHLLTVSGLHISILAGALNWLLKKCKVNKYIRVAIVSILLILYCYVCNWTPSVVRASVMGLAVVVAPLFAQRYDSLTAMGIAGLLILLFSPLMAFDIGFQMSFGCVFAILSLSKKLKNLLRKFIPINYARALAPTLSAQLGVFPFLIKISSEVNILSMFANIFIIPFFEVVFILLLIVVILAIIPGLSVLLKIPAFCFKITGEVAMFFDDTSAKFDFETMNIFVIVCYFAILTILGRFVLSNNKVRAVLLSIVVSICSVWIIVDSCIPVKSSNTISVIYHYDKANFFLCNSLGETLFIGNEFNSNDEKWIVKNGKHIDYIAISESSGNLLTIVQAKEVYGVQEMKSCSIEFGGKNCYLEGNESHLLGNFVIEYVFEQDIYLGIKIHCDKRVIFIASNKNLSYNMYDYLEKAINKDCDVAYLGDKTGIIKGIESEIVFTTKYADSNCFSFKDYGNMQLDLQNNIVRSLD